MATISLTGGFYQDDSLQFNAQRCVNMYPEQSVVATGKGNVKLTNVPGETPQLTYTFNFIDITDYRLIGSHTTSDGRLFTIIIYTSSYDFYPGSYITVTEYQYDYFTDNVINPIRSYDIRIPDSVDNKKITQCRTADNGKVISIVTGYISFMLDLSGLRLVEVTDPDYPTEVIDVVFKDTYFIWLDNATDRFYISKPYADDPTDCINALDFGTVESSPDKLKAVIGNGNEILIFGESTIEYFYNSGNVDFPFSRSQGTIQDTGCISRMSVRKIDKNRVCFVGSDKSGYGTVYVLSGYNLTRISTHAIEQKLKSSTELESSIAYAYMDEGHYFYCLNVDDLDTTLVYDFTTNVWHERARFVNGKYEKYPGIYHEFYNNKNLIIYNQSVVQKFEFGDDVYTRMGVTISSLDKKSYQLYDMTANEFDDIIWVPTNMKRERVIQHLINENKDVQYNKIELDIRKGMDNEPGYDDPNIEVIMSRDGGITYDEPIILDMGKIGEYNKKIIAYRLGVGRDVVFKIVSTSPVSMDWFNIYLDFGVLDA